MSYIRGSNAIKTTEMLSKLFDRAEAWRISSTACPIIWWTLFVLSKIKRVIFYQIMLWTSWVLSLSNIPSEQVRT